MVKLSRRDLPPPPAERSDLIVIKPSAEFYHSSMTAAQNMERMSLRLKFDSALRRSNNRASLPFICM